MSFPSTPRTRSICLQGLVALALCAALGSAGAMSRMGEAGVLEKDGLPCFVVPARELARGPNVRVRAVSVSDASTQPVVSVWRAWIDPPAAPSSAADCIAYGQLPARPEDPPPAVLQTGKVYEVYLNGRSSDPSDATRGYAAKFCLAVDAAGARRVIPVMRGTSAWHDGVCR
ncbi:hypothetical protein [Roseateles chitosanitabidus]|uniref:hypothetical protein n=1 Tax=Roseateles chitosanitabidus TaxID=65048 RepID=UPI00083267A4|nr:hypothetical protein [Roseateles chitosanitabidus]